MNLLLGKYLVIYILIRYCFILLFHGYLWWLLAKFVGANYTYYSSLCSSITSLIIAKQNFLYISAFISLISFIYVRFSLHSPINSLLCWHFCNSDLQYCQTDEICKAVLHWARYSSGALYISVPRKIFGRQFASGRLNIY